MSVTEVRRHGSRPADRRRVRTPVRRDRGPGHDQRSLTGVVRPLDDPDGVVDELVARVAGFGPLQPYLDDPAVEEIWINEPHRVFVARDGRHELTTTILTAAEVRDLVERMLKTSGRRVDVEHAVRRRDAAVGAPAARRPRRDQPRLQCRQHPQVRDQGEPAARPRRPRHPDAAGGRASSTPCVVAGLNIVVAGGTQAGKTTLAQHLGVRVARQ